VSLIIDNFFKGLRGKPVACVACTQRYCTNLKKKVEIGGPSISSSFYFFPPARVSVSSIIMAPPLDAVTHILIETLLKQRFENKLIT
jgi:hypothetical protein